MKKELTRDELLTRAVVFTAVTGSIMTLPHAGEAATKFNEHNYATQIIVDQTDGQEWYTDSEGNTRTKMYVPRGDFISPTDKSKSTTTHSDQLNVISITDKGVQSQTVSYYNYPKSWKTDDTVALPNHKETQDWYHPDASPDLIVSNDETASAFKYDRPVVRDAVPVAPGAEVRVLDKGEAIVVVAEEAKAPELTLTTGNLRQKAFNAAGELVSSGDAYHGTAEDGGSLSIAVQPSASNVNYRQTDYLSAMLHHTADAQALRDAIPSYESVSADLSNVYFKAVGGDISFVNGSVTVQANHLYGANNTTKVTRKDNYEFPDKSRFNGKIHIGSSKDEAGHTANYVPQRARVVLAGDTAFNAQNSSSDFTWNDYADNTITNAKDFIKLNPSGTLAGASAQLLDTADAAKPTVRTDAGNAIDFNGGILELTDATLTDTQLERAQDAVNKESDSQSLFTAWRDALKNGAAWTSSVHAPSVVRASASTKVTKDSTTMPSVADFSDTSQWEYDKYADVLNVLAANSLKNTSELGLVTLPGRNQFNLINSRSYVSHHDSSDDPDDWFESSDPYAGTSGIQRNIHASYINFDTAPTRILIGDDRHLTLSDGQGNHLIKIDGSDPAAGTNDVIPILVEGNSVLTLGGTVNSDNTLWANVTVNGTTTSNDSSALSSISGGAVLEVTNGTKTVNSVKANKAAIVLHRSGSLTADDLSTTAAADGTITATNGSRITVKDGGTLKAEKITLTTNSVMDVEAGSYVRANEITGSGFTLNYADAALDALGRRMETKLQNIRVTGKSTVHVGNENAAGDLHLKKTSVLTDSDVLLDPAWVDDSLNTLGYNPLDTGTYTRAFSHASTFSDTLSKRPSTVPGAADIEANALDYRLTVGRQSIASLGSTLEGSTSIERNRDAMRTFRESRFDWGESDDHAKNVTAALYLDQPVKLTYASSTDVGTNPNFNAAGTIHRTLVGGLTVDGDVTFTTGTKATPGHIVFGQDSLLMLNAAHIGTGPVLSSEDGRIDNTPSNFATISVDENARLYLTNITTRGVGVDNGQVINLIGNLNVANGEGWLNPNSVRQIYTYPLFGVVLDDVLHSGTPSANYHYIKVYRKSVTDVLPDTILEGAVNGIPDAELNKELYPDERSLTPGIRLVRKVFDNLLSPAPLSTSLPLTKAQATEVLNLAGNPSEAVGATANALRQTTVLAEEANDHFSALSPYAFSPVSIRNTPAGPASAFDDADRDGEIWFKAAHQRSETEGLKAAGNATDYDAKFNTFTLGYDFPQTQRNMRHGLSVSYGTGDGEQAHLSDDMKILGLSYYASLANKNNNLLLDAGYYETEHEVSGNLPYVGDRLDADSKTKVFTLGVTNEFVQKERNNVLVPHIGLRYSHVSTPSYTGRLNGEAAFRYSPESKDIFTLPIGVGFKRDFRKGDTTYRFLADFSYIPVLSGRDATMRTHLIGGGVDSFDNDVVSRNSYRAKLSFLAESDKSSYGLDYSYRGSSDTTSHYVGARFNFKF
ncbi:hypothetical protein TAMA11512_20220 [Selenomonas sp. TAMA-11512]|uniref:autotransporter family protein n=1 Tax=Selenomonas sp. TAMA-11512 TaxID=3095337 RepID=UPI00308F5C0B|nr:hypothetical protein TAMA11512_20220 [Selenomonas sp. TAMA-11512]